MQGWDDQQQPHQHGKSDGGLVQVPPLPQGVQSLSLADTGTLSMWSGNNKKSHFSSWCTAQSNRDKSLRNACLQTQLAILLYIHEIQSWIFSWKSWKSKGPTPTDTSPVHRRNTVPGYPPSFHPSSKTGACRTTKPNTGSHSLSENVRETPRCWLRRLTAATPEYFTTLGSSE